MTTFRYWASVKAAAGVGEEGVPAATLSEGLAAVRDRHDARFAEVLAVCALVVDGDPVGRRDHAAVTLAADSLVDCLPPFAGG